MPDGMSTNAKRIAGGVAAVGIVGLLGAWFLSARRKAAERVAESGDARSAALDLAKKAGRGMFMSQLLGWGVGLGALVGGGLFLSWYFRNKIDNLVGDARAKISGFIDRGERLAEQGRQKIDSAGDSAQTLREDIAQRKTELETTVAERGPDAVESIQEIAALALIEKVLPMQFDVAEKLGKENPNEFMAKTKNIVSLVWRQGDRVKLDLFTSCMGANDTEKNVDASLLRIFSDFDKLPEGEKKSWREGFRFFVAYLEKNRGSIESNAKLFGRKTEELTLGQAMNFFAQIPTALGNMAGDMKAAMLDIFDRKMPDIDFSKVFNAETYTNATLKHLILPLSGEELETLTPKRRGEIAKDAEKVVEFFTIGSAANITIADVRREDAIPATWKEDDKLKKEFEKPYEMVRKLCEEVQNEKTRIALQEAVFIKENELTEDAEFDTDRRIIAEYSRIIDNGELRLPDALQLYTMLRGDATARPLLSFKAIDLLGKYGTPQTKDLAIDRYFELGNRLADAAVSDMDLEGLNLSDDQKRELRNVGLYVQSEFMEEMKELWLWYAELWEHNPEIAALLTGAVAAPTLLVGGKLTLTGMRTLNQFRWNGVQNLIDMGPDKLMAKYNLRSIEQAEQCIDHLRSLVARASQRSVLGDLMFKRWGLAKEARTAASAIRSGRLPEAVAAQVRAAQRASRPRVYVIRRPGSAATEAASTVAETTAPIADDAARLTQSAATTADEARAAATVTETAETVTPIADDAVRATETIAENTDTAARSATDIVESLDNGKQLLSHGPTKYLLNGNNADETAKLLQAAHEVHGLAGAKRASRYLLAIGNNVDESRRVAMCAPEVIKLVAEGTSGNPAAIARFLGTVPTKAGFEISAEGFTKTIGQMSRWQKAGTGLRVLYGAGVAAEAGMLAWDTYNLVNAIEERRTQRAQLAETLKGIGLESTDGETFEGCGVKVTLSEVENTDVEEYASKVALGSAALGTTLILGPSVMLGPPGLVIAGVVITATVVIGGTANAMEQRKHQEFLKKAPHWLLSMIGTHAFIGQTEHETIREYGPGIMSQDIFPSTWTEVAQMLSPVPLPGDYRVNRILNARETVQDREKLRDKLVQSMCFRAIANNYPELLTELPDLQGVSGGTVDATKSLYGPESAFLAAGGDFEKIVRPYIVMRLHTETKGESIDFGATQRLDITDNRGGFFDGSWMGMEMPTVSQYELADAVEESMLFYVNHVREVRYRERVKQIDQLITDKRIELEAKTSLSPEQRTEELALFEAGWREAIREEADENKDSAYIFNRNPAELPSSTDGMTLAQRMISERTARLDNMKTDVSAAQAAEGWTLPWLNQPVGIYEFANDYIRPQFREKDRERLVRESPKAGEPFSFDELNQMGQNSRDFLVNFHNKIAKCEKIDAELAQGIGSDEQLKTLAQENGDLLDFYVKVYKNAGYYNDYVRHWRNYDAPIVRNGSLALVEQIQKWRENRYPTLIPEGVIKSWQQRVAGRRLGPQQQQALTLDFFNRNKTDVRLESSTPGQDRIRIPGADLSREGVVMFSYGGYMDFIRNAVKTAPAQEQPGEFRLFDDRATDSTLRGTPFAALNRPAPTIRQETGAAQDAYRKFLEGGDASKSLSYFDIGLTQQSLLSLGRQSELLAVTPQELQAFIQELNATPAMVKLDTPEFIVGLALGQPGEDYALLQQHMLQSRLLVIVDQNPQQQSLPLRIRP